MKPYKAERKAERDRQRRMQQEVADWVEREKARKNKEV
jgi:hypothetical protein